MAAETVLVDGIEKKIVRIIPYRGIKLKKGASGSSIAKADDIHRQIHFENSAGGIAYLITLSQPGGHDMPWNAGETSKKKASGRLSQPDKLLIFNELTMTPLVADTARAVSTSLSSIAMIYPRLNVSLSRHI